MGITFIKGRESTFQWVVVSQKGTYLKSNWSTQFTKDIDDAQLFTEEDAKKQAEKLNAQKRSSTYCQVRNAINYMQLAWGFHYENGKVGCVQKFFNSLEPVRNTLPDGFDAAPHMYYTRGVLTWAFGTEQAAWRCWREALAQQLQKQQSEVHETIEEMGEAEAAIAALQHGNVVRL